MQSVYTEVILRRRDIGDAEADRQNRAQADGVTAGIRGIINDIKSDPIGAAAGGLMIPGDIILGGPTGESVAGIGSSTGELVRLAEPQSPDRQGPALHPAEMGQHLKSQLNEWVMR